MDSGLIRSDAVASRGSRESVLSGLFRAHCVELVQLAYLLLGDRAWAEAAVQEAYLSLFRHWPLADERSALAYLRAGVINGCGSHERRVRSARRRQPPARVSMLEAHTGPDAATASVARDESTWLAEQVRALPRRQQEVITCRYYLQLSEWETAGFLEIRVGSVRRQAQRGLATLRSGLEGS